jgi:hypothetical protein
MVNHYITSGYECSGHGMLPMLAHSRREFLVIKAIGFAAALAFGSVAVNFGW